MTKDDHKLDKDYEWLKFTDHKLDYKGLQVDYTDEYKLIWPQWTTDDLQVD